MSLILSVKEGEDFYVGEERFEVVEIVGATTFRLLHDVPDAPVQHCITEEHAVEILPDVWVSAGDGHPSNVACAVIRAPRAVLILRGSLKNRAEAV